MTSYRVTLIAHEARFSVSCPALNACRFQGRAHEESPAHIQEWRIAKADKVEKQG